MSNVRRAALAASLASCAILSLHAQTSRATVAGLVTDPSGAAVANADVELKGAITRSTKTTESGVYRFDAVDPGLYTVSVKQPGFETSSRAGIDAAAGAVITADFRLKVGETTTVIEVDATTEALQIETPVRGGSITGSQAALLPIQGRNAVNMALTLPGVTTNRFGFGTGSQGNGTFPVNGSRGRSNNFMIDGTENNDISVAGQALQIRNPYAVQEVAVQTSNFDSEFGRAGGAVVNVITRSGTNELHGTLHYILDSTFDDAITNTQSLSAAVIARGRPLPGTEQWYGATVTGPIKKNSTFFAASFQDQRQNSQSTATLNTISAAGRETLNRLFPRGTNPRVDLYNEVTAGATATSQFFPVELGDGRPAIQFGTAAFAYAQTYRSRQITSRIDHRISNNDQLSGRYVIDDQKSPQGGATNFFPGFSTSSPNRLQNVALTETHIFSPTMTNELRLSYNRITFDFPADTASQLGRTMPFYSIAGLSGIGLQTNLPQGRIANNYSLQDTISIVRGRHSFRTGFDLLDQRSRQVAPSLIRGSLTYAAVGTVFTGFANFVDDFGGSGGGASRDFGSATYFPSLTRQAYFFQDRWRATNSLTLSLGIRYEYFGLPMNSLIKPAYSGIFNLDPRTFTGPYTEPNKVEGDKNNFSPMIGISYSPEATSGLLGRLLGNKRTVIRTGYQIGYDSFFNNIASNAVSAVPNLVATSAPSVVTTDNPRGARNLSTTLPRVARAPIPVDSQTLMLRNLRNPYYQRWSFGIQRELPMKTILDISYVGSKGTRLFANEDMNPQVPASLRIMPAGVTPPYTTQGRLDNLQGGRLTRTNGGSSSYHSLQTLVNRRFSSGFSLRAAYTFSKAIDNASEVFGVAQTNLPQNTQLPAIFGGLRFDRGLSFFDRTHRAVFTYIYELPLGRTGNGLTKRVLGGWQISGVTSFEAGVPLTVFAGVDQDGIGGNFDRAFLNPGGSPFVRAVRNTSRCPSTGYCNPDANNAPIERSQARYISEPAHTGNDPLPTGTLGRNTLRTPGINNFDWNIQKTTMITERMRLELRAEFFNLWNHPQYGSPSVSPFAPTSPLGIGANVTTTPAGRFLQPQFADGGGRVMRYQLAVHF